MLAALKMHPTVAPLNILLGSSSPGPTPAAARECYPVTRRNLLRAGTVRKCQKRKSGVPDRADAPRAAIAETAERGAVQTRCVGGLPVARELPEHTAGDGR